MIQLAQHIKHHHHAKDPGRYMPVMTLELQPQDFNGLFLFWSKSIPQSKKLSGLCAVVKTTRAGYVVLSDDTALNLTGKFRILRRVFLLFKYPCKFRGKLHMMIIEGACTESLCFWIKCFVISNIPIEKAVDSPAIEKLDL